MRAPALLGLLLSLSCADEGEPIVGHGDPCDLPQAPLLECPPPQTGPEELSVAEACHKLVDCGILALDIDDPGDTDPEDDEDYIGCIARLEDNPPDRLLYSLRCIEVSTCTDLREGFDGPCFVFGRDP